MTDDEAYRPYADSIFLNTTYWRLSEALGYPKREDGKRDLNLYEVLEDAVHMIELGHRYLDLTEG